MRSVEVYRNGILAGVLTEEHRNSYVFRYDETYFLDNSKSAISLTLPKNIQEYRNNTLFPFFFNLLSEGVNRKLQCRILKIDEDDHFGLLLQTTQSDTVGNITTRPLPS
jgi:HipA-like protein